ncbi:MAG: hypothetical protein IJT50_12590 [Lentisphaeria bacterium]|jgi:threonine dehydrogenase-like Zn-dependent dehydrogenase|nr:hypothetical protein [Lentisphaeria bacterium]
MTKERFMALLHGDGVIRMESVPLPELAENEVRIKVDCSLVSPGTEMVPVRAFRQKHDLSAAPKRFGYACAGVITEVRGNVKNLKPGDRVAAMGGGAKHANWVNVPVNLAVPIPDRLSFEEATFACLGATSLHAVRQADPQLSDYGLVLGGGLVGNMAAQLSQLSGARVLLWETLAGRRRIARKCRLKNVRDPRRSSAGEDAAAFAAPYGFDFAVFAFGGQATAAFHQVQRVMKLSADGHRMGKIILVGGCLVEVGGGASSGNLRIISAARTGAGYHDTAWEYGRDYPNAFVRYTTQRNLNEIVRLIAEKRLLVKPMITATLGLEETNTAADMLLDTPDKVMGIILKMPH